MIRKDIIALGGLEVFVSLITTSWHSEDLKLKGCDNLALFARAHHDNKDAIRTAGAVPALLEQVQCGTPKLKEACTSVLALLAHNNRRNQDSIQQQGGIPLLVHLERHGTKEQKGAASRALDALEFMNSTNREHVRHARKMDDHKTAAILRKRVLHAALFILIVHDMILDGEQKRHGERDAEITRTIALAEQMLAESDQTWAADEVYH